jgi:hypothetical protein
MGWGTGTGAPQPRRRGPLMTATGLRNTPLCDMRDTVETLADGRPG